MQENIYQSPNSRVSVNERQQTSIAGKWLAIVGSIFLLGLPIGVLSTIISMIELFQSITLYGEGDPKVMAGGISQALISTVLGVVVALPGAVLLAISILFFKHRKPWVYRVSIVAAIFTLLMFPIGTIVAIIILVKIIRNKDSYFLMQQFD
ncbi:MAG: MotA/TolQ/ExbB proton channel family protein [Kangiellaceae bacterium]|nr:MotA/TolQ/ExbB proton channel family protein [Kangiellaceae bacterium]